MVARHLRTRAVNAWREDRQARAAISALLPRLDEKIDEAGAAAISVAAACCTPGADMERALESFDARFKELSGLLLDLAIEVERLRKGAFKREKTRALEKLRAAAAAFAGHVEAYRRAPVLIEEVPRAGAVH